MPPSHHLAFGPFRLDPQAKALSCDGRPVRLMPKDVEVLLLLVEHQGSLVPRERFFAELWPGVVVEDCNLARHVATLRQALGDSAEAPTYIETVPKRGYRFSAPVTTVPAGRPPERPLPADAASASAVPPRQAGIPAGASRWISAALTVATLASGAWAWAHVAGHFGSPGQLRGVAVLPVENRTGDRELDLMADELGELFVHDLGEAGDLTVVSQRETRRFAGSTLPARSIARLLGVQDLVECTLVRVGGRLQMTAELVNARTGRLVWSGQDEGEVGDLRPIERGLAQGVAAELRAGQ